MAKLAAFEIGQIKAHAYHDLSAPDIAALVLKTDGTNVTAQAVRDTLAKLAADETWRGERAESSGRSRKTTRALDKAILREVIKMRGAAKVTVAFH